MTTPTTPAAARVAFERDAEPMGFDLRRHECMVPEPWSEYHDINTGHRWGGYLAATHAAAARESALIADVQRYRYLRDIKRRDCLTLTGPDAGVWCDAEDEDRNLMLLTEDDLDQAIDAAMQKERKWDAHLAAPAVEGGCDGHKKIRDSATTLDAELASLNAMRYNRAL